LLDLLAMGDLEIELFENSTGVQTVETNIGQLDELVLFMADKLRYHQVSRSLIDQLAGSSGKGASRWFNRFERHVKCSGYTADALTDARADWLDRSYTASPFL